MKKISVIIAVYNAEKFLKKCINSILRQTYDNYEIICVDDCSTDDSRSILQKYATKYPDKIKIYFREENGGAAFTKQLGVEKSTGEYITFVDSDDYIKKNYLETYVYNLNDETDIVIGGYIRDVDGKLTKHRIPDSDFSMVTYPIVAAKLFRKQFIIENNLDFSKFRCGEDIYISLLSYCYHARYKVIDYCGYYYYLNTSSTTVSLYKKNSLERDMVEIFDAALTSGRRELLTKKEYQIVEYAFISNMVNTLVTYNKGCGTKEMNRKYTYMMSALRRKFPDYKENPYCWIWNSKGATPKVRLGVGIWRMAHAIHMDKLMFRMIANISYLPF